MPKCLKCGGHYPNRIIVKKNKKAVSRNRIYCFKCSPYGEHNTSSLIKEEKNLECICTKCGRAYKYKRSKGHTFDKCNSCQQIERRKKLKKELVNYKGSKCVVCGYDRCIEALAFHHLDKKEKELAIGSCWNRSVVLLKKEADKCKLVCNRCHTEIHEGLINI